MRSFTLTTLLAATTALATPINVQLPDAPNYLQWKPAGPGDLRCACPALNALANHGFLPRDGRNITLPMLQTALPLSMNVGKDLAEIFFNGAVKLGLTHDSQFNLPDLNKHNAVEHDGSLSRADASTGNHWSFNKTIFNSYMAQFKGKETITIEMAAKARMFRINTEKARDKQFTYEKRQQLISNGESSLILGLFGDIDEGNAKKSYIKTWFGKSLFYHSSSSTIVSNAQQNKNVFPLWRAGAVPRRRLPSPRRLP